MFGVNALQKFAAWDKVDLLDLLLEYFRQDLDHEARLAALNSTSPSDGFSALHHCVDMGAARSLGRLLREPGTDASVQDKKGRTPLELAKQMGATSLVGLLDNSGVDDAGHGATTLISVRTAIRDVGTLPKQEVTVAGVVSSYDASLHRLDINGEGAKLICDVERAEGLERMALEAGANVRVTGKLMKQQRRTFLSATGILIHSDG